jgi:hypothetical protein
MPTLRKLRAGRRHHSSLFGQSPTRRCAQQRSGMRSQGNIQDGGSDSHMPLRALASTTARTAPFALPRSGINHVRSERPWIS